MSRRAIAIAVSAALLLGVAALAITFRPGRALAVGFEPGRQARMTGFQDGHDCGDPEARAARLAEIAGLLGMSVEELEAALGEGKTSFSSESGASFRSEGGKTLAQLAEEKGVSLEELRDLLPGRRGGPGFGWHGRGFGPGRSFRGAGGNP